MKRCLKKSLALLLALLMALSAMSVMAMAAEDDPDTAEAAVILDADGTDENDVEADTELECPEDVAAPAGFVSSGEDADQQEITTLATVDSGTYGSNLTWTLDSDGTLTVSGTGEMEEVSTPWRSYRDSITKIVVSEGVTSTSTECFIYCEAATSVSLPSTLVTIGSGTFYGCTSLTSITIPDHVTTIKQGAFAACTSLEDIHLGSSVQKIETYAFQNVAATNLMIPASVTSIDGLAFFDSTIGSFSAEANGTYTAADGVLYTDNGKTLFAYPQGSSAASFTVPSGVTRIGDGSFAYAKNLTAISIPSTVTYLGESSFQHMYSLESVAIPDSVTEVGYFTFYGCLKLTTVTFGSGLESTIYEMFEECSSLTTINFGTGLKNIYSRTFAYCSSLKSVTLPANVESIGTGCFGECNNLTTFVSQGISGTIAFQAFLNDTSLSSVTLNEGVTYIARTAFYGCSSLKSITLPASVEFVHFLAFPTTTVITNKNSDLRVYEETGYRIEDDVIVSGTNRYDMAYQVLDLVNQERNAEGLSSLVMDESLLSTAMMRGCEVSLLFEHTRPDGSRCFTANSAMYAENIAMGYSSAASVVNGWMNSSGHRSNIMSSSYTTVGIGCFYINGTYYWTQCFGRGSSSASCPQPANQTVSNTVSLAVGTFEEPIYTTGSLGNPDYYSYEYSLQLPSFMSAGASTDAAVYITGSSNTGYPVPIENSSFTFTSSNPGILTVSSAGTVRGVSTGTAAINASLAHTTLSKDITVISDEVIDTGMCGDNLTWAVTSDHVLMIEGTGAMYGYNEGYEPWYGYRDDITMLSIGNGVTSIGRYAFADLANVTEVEIPDTVTSIGYGAFQFCESLIRITIPDSVTSISDYVFFACYDLEEAVIGSGISGLGSYDFGHCRSLTDVSLSDKLTSIGSSAFYNCTSLTTITIPSSVTEIGTYAFRDCKILTSITIEGNAPLFGSSCFSNVKATVYYPCGNDTWDEYLMQNYGGTITWTATGHTWGEVTWAWSSGYSSATASRTCEKCGETESQEARVLCDITNPTCTQEGKSVYTATAVFDNIEYTDVQSVAIPAAGHTWGNVTWNWAPDYSSATASRTCTVCGAVESTAATVTSKTTSPTCTDPGTIIYTATADFNGTSYSDTAVVETEPALGHDWGEVIWAWSADHSSASASRTCIVCGAKETVNAAVTSQVISEPTEEKDGEIVYTASATFSDGTKVSNSVSVVMPFTNKEALDEEIGKAEAEEKYKDDYTAASWADFQAALDAAKSVLNDVTATQEKVDQALADLEQAYDNLVPAPIPEYLQGFNELNGNWYYFVNGNIAYGMNDVLEGTVKGTTGWWYIVNGQVQLNYTGVCNYSNAYGWWYVKNGMVDFSKTGIEQNNYGWWRVVGGKVDFSCNSVEQNDYGWWYVLGGQVQFGYTGVANYANAYGWWYIKGGQVDFSKTSIEQNAYGWWRVVGGKVDFGCNSVEQNDYGWWYVVGGQVQFGYTGVANYANAYGWWYISGGQVDFSKTSVEQNNYGWWRVENGKVNFSYTGWARNNFGTWYCVNGKVDFSRS